MTDPQTPEPTPAVERAARVLDPDAFALRSPANRKLLIPPVTARARKILAAALDVEEMARALYEAIPDPEVAWEHLDDIGKRYYHVWAAAQRTAILGATS